MGASNIIKVVVRTVVIADRKYKVPTHVRWDPLGQRWRVRIIFDYTTMTERHWVVKGDGLTPDQYHEKLQESLEKAIHYANLHRPICNNRRTPAPQRNKTSVDGRPPLPKNITFIRRALKREDAVMDRFAVAVWGEPRKLFIIGKKGEYSEYHYQKVLAQALHHRDDVEQIIQLRNAQARAESIKAANRQLRLPSKRQVAKPKEGGLSERTLQRRAQEERKKSTYDLMRLTHQWVAS